MECCRCYEHILIPDLDSGKIGEVMTSVTPNKLYLLAKRKTLCQVWNMRNKTIYYTRKKVKLHGEKMCYQEIKAYQHLAGADRQTRERM